MERYNFKIVEKTWQKFWEDKKTFSTKIDKNKIDEVAKKCVHTFHGYGVKQLRSKKMAEFTRENRQMQEIKGNCDRIYIEKILVKSLKSL